MEYSNDQLKELIEDAEYLLDEAEALGYVINSVPVYDKPPGSESVFEMLAIIDHAQKKFYRQAIEQIYKRPGSTIRLEDFRKTFTVDEDEKNASKLLIHIGKNRSAIITFLKKMPLKDMLIQGTLNGKDRSIASLVEEMVEFERVQLKRVAERILSIDTGRSSKE